MLPTYGQNAIHNPVAVRSINNGFIGKRHQLVGWLVGWMDGWLSPSVPGPAQIPFLRPSRVVRFWPSRAKVWIFYVALFWYHKSFSSWFSKVLRVTAFRSVVSAQFVSLRFFQFLHFAFVVFSPGFLEWLWPNLPLLLIDYVGYLI